MLFLHIVLFWCFIWVQEILVCMSILYLIVEQFLSFALGLLSRFVIARGGLLCCDVMWTSKWIPTYVSRPVTTQKTAMDLIISVRTSNLTWFVITKASSSFHVLVFFLQLLDHNVQQIVDHGFTVEQAEYSLRQNRNNVERALRALQVRTFFIYVQMEDICIIYSCGCQFCELKMKN